MIGSSNPEIGGSETALRVVYQGMTIVDSHCDVTPPNALDHLMMSLRQFFGIADDHLITWNLLVCSLFSHSNGNQLLKTLMAPRFPDSANGGASGITVLGYQSELGKR